MTEVAYKTRNEPKKAYTCMELRGKSKENNSSGKKTAIKKMLLKETFF